MPTSLHDTVSAALVGLLERGDLSLVAEDNELHIVADDWTLILQGEPMASAMIALDDESGDPQALLGEVISTDELAALRELDTAIAGDLTAQLADSPDPLAQALAALLRA